MESTLVDRGPFRRAALRSYILRMSAPNPKGILDDVVADVLRQQGFDLEEDPRSIYEPQQLYTALSRYATRWSEFEKFDEHLEEGFRKAYKIFAKPKHRQCLSILTDAQVQKKALKMSKSSGLPLMTSKAESLTYSFNREWQVRHGEKHPNPCVAYKRTQKGNKTRLVWGYPLEMTIMESRFARPLIDQFKSMETPMAFGMTKAELGARLHRYFEDQPGTTICLDFSKFDSTISQHMVRYAFRILATWFDDKDKQEFGWKTVVDYFVHTPIVMPDGHLYTGKTHGVPSGSYFTQMIDSVVNVAVMYALKSKFKLSFSLRQLLVLGDDVILKHLGHYSLKRMADYLSTFGLVLHDDEKTVVGQVHFLGATWMKGKPDAPVGELVSKASWPESFRVHGSNPYADAIGVLRSYACNYLSAIRFLPSSSRSRVWTVDKPPTYCENLPTSFLSGSEKFFEEEYAHFRSNSCEKTLSYRLLL